MHGYVWTFYIGKSKKFPDVRIHDGSVQRHKVHGSESYLGEGVVPLSFDGLSDYLLEVKNMSLQDCVSNWGCGTAQVFRVDFWMQIFKSKSPKPTSIVSSSPCIKTLLGPGVKRKSSTNPTCRKYVDSEGKTRYHGTPELKCTQTLVETLVWFHWFPSKL